MDILVRSHNPERLDDTINMFGAAVVGRGVPGGIEMVGDCIIVRVLNDAWVGIVKNVITTQCGDEVVEDKGEKP